MQAISQARRAVGHNTIIRDGSFPSNCISVTGMLETEYTPQAIYEDIPGFDVETDEKESGDTGDGGRRFVEKGAAHCDGGCRGKRRRRMIR